MTRARQTLLEPGVVLRHYSSDEAATWRAAWLIAYGASRNGVNVKAFLWHVFSAGRYPCQSGAAALAEYRQQSCVEYIVLSNDGKCAFLTDLRPEKVDLQDYYVFPPNLAWCMAMTHEDGWLGPYFARHTDFERLNQANLAQLRKRQEAELARARGWC